MLTDNPDPGALSSGAAHKSIHTYSSRVPVISPIAPIALISWASVFAPPHIGGSAAAFAQSWPARPVRIVVPYTPGGGIDTVARMLAQKLTEQLGASFIVENRPGAAGILGSEVVAR